MLVGAAQIWHNFCMPYNFIKYRPIVEFVSLSWMRCVAVTCSTVRYCTAQQRNAYGVNGL